MHHDTYVKKINKMHPHLINLFQSNFPLHNIILDSVHQHNHFITQGNYKATCFNCRLDIFRPIFSIVSQDAMHTVGSHHAYIHGIHQIKSFVSRGVTCKLCHYFGNRVCFTQSHIVLIISFLLLVVFTQFILGTK